MNPGRNIFSALALAFAAALPAQLDCSTQVGINLRVDGPGTPASSLRFVANYARTDSFGFLFLSQTRGPLAIWILNLCVDTPFALVPLGAMDSAGSAELSIQVPSLPPESALRLYAQAVAIPPSLAAAEVRTSNVANVDLYAPTNAFAVTNVTPGSGSANTTVTILGRGFGVDATRVTVWIGGTPVPPVSVADGVIQLMLPHIASTGALPLQVQVGIARADAGSFTFNATPSGPVPGWISVGFPSKTAAAAPDLEDRVRQNGGRILDLDLALQSAICVVSPGNEFAFSSAMLASGASYAEQDRLDDDEDMGDRGAANDPVRGSQWHLDLVGGQTVPGPVSPVIGVIDSGADTAHPDLSGRLLLAPRVLLNVAKKTTNLNDTDGHGTRVTGVIAANPDNGLHVTGMTRNLQVLPVRVTEDNGIASNAMKARGIMAAVSLVRSVMKRPLVLNISRTLFAHPDLPLALGFAESEGVAVVKSAGNAAGGGDVTYEAPTAAYPDIVLVSGIARDRDGTGKLQIWPNSCRTQTGAPVKRQVDIAAPAEGIVSINPGDSNNGPTGANGTSEAAPQVAAAIATIWSWTPQQIGEPMIGWRNRVIDMLLKGCVRDIGAANRDDLFGDGVLDLSGRLFFHTRNSRMYSQRSKREVSDLRGPYQVRNYSLLMGTNPAWAGDRRAFAYDRFIAGSPPRSEVVVMSLEADEAYNIAPLAVLRVNGAALGQPTFDPRTGEWLCFLWNNDIWACTKNGMAWRPLVAGGNGIRHTPHWSSNGSHIVFGEDGRIMELEVVRDGQGGVAGGGVVRTMLAPPPAFRFVTPAYAPDAVADTMTGRVAFAALWDDPGFILRTEIYNARIDGSDFQRLTNDGRMFEGDGSENFGPGWSPDGQRIAYHRLEYRNRRAEFRHVICAVPASPPAMGYATPEVLYDAGWSNVAIPMGIQGGPNRYYSSVDASRF